MNNSIIILENVQVDEGGMDLVEISEEEANGPYDISYYDEEGSTFAFDDFSKIRFGDDHVSSDANHSRQTAIALATISAIGLLLNILVIVIITVLGDYKKTSHWYVLNLAIADGLFLLLLPFDAVQSHTGEWKLGKAACVMTKGSFYINYYAGMLILTVMSFDRYVAIIFPMSVTWKKFRSRIGSGLTTTLVWMLAICASLPQILHVKLVAKQPEFLYNGSVQCQLEFHNNDIKQHNCINAGVSEEDCDEATEMANNDSFIDMMNATLEYLDYNELAIESETDDGLHYCKHKPYSTLIIWVYMNTVFAFIVPTLVMGFCYGRILWRVLHPKVDNRSYSSRRGSGKSLTERRRLSSTSSANRRRNHRVTVLVVSLVTGFLVCWAPFQILNAVRLKKMSDHGPTCKRLVLAFTYLAYCGSVLNPLLYTFLSANFGKRAQRVIDRIRGRRTSSHVVRTTKTNNGRATNTTKFSKSATDSTIHPHINMQLLPPHPKREPSMS